MSDSCHRIIQFKATDTIREHMKKDFYNVITGDSATVCTHGFDTLSAYLSELWELAATSSHVIMTQYTITFLV